MEDNKSDKSLETAHKRLIGGQKWYMDDSIESLHSLYPLVCSRAKLRNSALVKKTRCRGIKDDAVCLHIVPVFKTHPHLGLPQ